MAEPSSNLSILLNKIAVEQHYTNFHISITPISSTGGNYTSKLYRVQVTDDSRNKLQLYAKTAALSMKLREQVVMNMYGTEILMYTELLRVFRQLEEIWKVPKEHKMAIPKFYGADSTYQQEIIVLEDLSCRGFQMHSRLETVSWPYAAAALTQLAKFHALSFAYRHEDPASFENVQKKLKSGLLAENEGNKMFYNNSNEKALKAVRDENKDKLQRFIDGSSFEEFFNMYRVLRHPVIIHTDFKPSNMLHKLRNDGTLELIVLDYQTLQVGCPVIDLLFFIFTSTDGPFRAKHYQQLLDHYHSELGVALAMFGLDVEDTYSRADFEFELEEMLPYGLKVFTLLMPIHLVAEDEASTPDDNLDMDTIAVCSGDIYVRRLNEVVDDYVAFGILI